MNEHIKNLIQLCKDNPDLKIKVIVDSDVVTDPDEYQSWMGEIERVEKDIYWMPEGFYIGEDDIIEQISYDMENEPEYANISDKEYKNILQKEFARLKECDEIKEAILIYIGV